MQSKDNKIIAVIGAVIVVLAVIVIMIKGYHNSSDYSSEYDKIEDYLQQTVRNEIFSIEERICNKTEECDWLTVKVYNDVYSGDLGKVCPVCGSGH